MPLAWTISHPERIAIATGNGEVTLMDLFGFMRALTQGGVLSYPRIIDLSHATLALKAAEIRNIAQGVSAATANGTLGTIGPVAFVAKSEEVRDMTALFEDRTLKTARPLRVCASVTEAHQWLDGLAQAKAAE